MRGTYRGYDIVSMPQPSSGGVVLLEMLNILEGFPMHDMKQGSAPSLHVMIEAMKRAYADRARYLGDPAFVSAPVAILISKDYAAKQRASIDLERATPWTDALSATPPREGSNTTHFSVVDSRGNAVSNTYTLNFPYGVGLVAEGTGVLLNNELDDFTAAPGASNAFGLVGFEANLPGPGKRPLSSMSPTIVLKDGKPVLVTGSPGGSRIISTVLQVIVDVLDYGMDVAAAVAAPRLHHQWLPDEVRIEHGFADEALAAAGKGPPRDRTAGPDLGEFDCGDRRRFARRPRSAYPWRGGGGAIGPTLSHKGRGSEVCQHRRKPMTSLKGKTLFISGASRGIGLAIALRAARDGANIAIAAKTAEPHPLPGTIYTAADEIEGRRQGAADRLRHPSRRIRYGGGRQDRRANSAASISASTMPARSP